MNLDPTTVLAGGFVTSALGNRLGIGDNPILTILAATCGGAALSKIRDYYERTKNVLPPMIRLNIASDAIRNKLGLKFYTLVIKESDTVIYNKIEAYILKRYTSHLISTYVEDSVQKELKLSLNGSEFSKPIVDHYKGERVLLSIESNEIRIESRTLQVEEIKEYVMYLLRLKIGTRTIYIHQPTIETCNTKGSDNSNVSNHNNPDSVSVTWNTIEITTNKTFENTILSKSVEKEFVEDLRHFTENEEYYNHKGIPYKRGYLLKGPPGTGKTSMIKAAASLYGMEVFVINMGEVRSERELTKLFQGTRSCHGYHILCFEDIDRCEFLSHTDRYSYDSKSKKSMIRTFINELDGVIETPNRITILTANDSSVIESIPALIRPGRIDKIITIDYCDVDQLNRIYNHFSDSGEVLRMKEGELREKVSPAQVIKHILLNVSVGVEEFKSQLDLVSKITVSEDKGLSGIGGDRKRRVRRYHSFMRRRMRIGRIKRDLRRELKRYNGYEEWKKKQEKLLEKLEVIESKRKEKEARQRLRVKRKLKDEKRKERERKRRKVGE